MAYFNKVFSRNTNRQDFNNIENNRVVQNNYDLSSKEELKSSNETSEKVEETDDGFQKIGQEIFEKMLNDKNPKFRNSQFLAFIKKIAEGKLILRNEQVRNQIN